MKIEKGNVQHVFRIVARSLSVKTPHPHIGGSQERKQKEAARIRNIRKAKSNKTTK